MNVHLRATRRSSIGLLTLLLLAPVAAACGGGGGGNGEPQGLYVSGLSPGTIPSEMDRGFTVTGNDFEPVGETASIRLTAIAGTPFMGGTAATVTFTGTIESASRVTGTTEACGVSEAVDARITVVLPDAREATSSSALTTVAPPQLTGVTPSVLRSRLPISFSVNGQDLGNLGDTVTIRFTAPSGTPFLGRTSATLDVDPILTVSFGEGGSPRL